MGSMKVYKSLTFSECCTLSRIELLIPGWIFSVQSTKCTLCTHSKSNLASSSIVKNYLLSELALSGGNDRRLCQSLQLVELHWSICKHAFLRIIFKSNTMSVKRAINTNITEIVANHVESAIISGYSTSEVEEKSTPSLPYIMKSSGQLSKFLLLVKKSSTRQRFVISSDDSC